MGQGKINDRLTAENFDDDLRHIGSLQLYNDPAEPLEGSGENSNVGAGVMWEFGRFRGARKELF